MNLKRFGILSFLSVLVIVVLLLDGCTQKQVTSGSNSIDITGAWHGTYGSAMGKGEWSWIIKKTGNGYNGILTTTKPYNGENVPVSVTLDGNKITVGWVAVGVVFEGTVSGDKMSGKWKFQNGKDSGSWEGSRGESSITPKETSNAVQTPQGVSGGTTGLPVYPGSHESNQYNTWATVTGFSGEFSEFHGYVVDGASPSDIINWYKSHFSDYDVDNQGTTNVQGTSFASLTLKKGNTLIGVIAFEQEGKTVYFVGKATMSEEEGDSLPNHDLASGEEPLERYPKSIMLDYTKSGDFPIDYEITYGTNSAFDKVSEWFKKTLQSDGWNITDQSGSSDTIELVFKKNDDEVTVWVGAPGAGTAYTQITVSYTRRSLPDHDLASGTEPLERYPGSVMIEYDKSAVSVQGYSSNEIKMVYLVPDTFEKVKQWYISKLKNMYFLDSDDESIDASAESGSTTIHIDFEKHNTYTEVSVDYITGI